MCVRICGSVHDLIERKPLLFLVVEREVEGDEEKSKFCSAATAVHIEIHIQVVEV